MSAAVTLEYVGGPRDGEMQAFPESHRTVLLHCMPEHLLTYLREVPVPVRVEEYVHVYNRYGTQLRYEGIRKL